MMNTVLTDALFYWREQALLRNCELVPTQEELAQWATSSGNTAQSVALQRWHSVIDLVRMRVELGYQIEGMKHDDNYFVADEEVPVPAETAPQSSFQPKETPVEDPQLRDYEDYEFAALNIFEDISLVAGVDFRIKMRPDGTIALSWTASPSDNAPEKAQLFRVISDEEPLESDTGAGELRCVTIGQSWVDTEPVTTAIRYYQLWLNEGDSEVAARANQPQLLGSGYIIAPVPQLNLSFDGTNIRGQWQGYEGTHHIAVHVAPAGQRRLERPSNRRAADQRNLQGFRWTPERKGITYQVTARRFVDVDGTLEASPWTQPQTIEVPAIPESVDIEVSADADHFHVAWENPNAGVVRIYRTQTPPPEGLLDTTVSVEQLKDFGLADRDWINDLEQGKNYCDFIWPETWYSLFITPVTVVGDVAQVGNSIARVHVGTLHRVTLHEQVTNQLITFTWPEEAYEVVAFFSQPGEGIFFDPHDDAIPIGAIDKLGYLDRGGLRVKLAAPGDVIVVPCRIYQGQRVWGEPVIIDYAGIELLRYSLFTRQGRLYVELFSEREEWKPREFTVRYLPDRLPLEPGDGQEVRVRNKRDHRDPFLPGIYTQHLTPHESDEQWEIDPSVAAPGRGFLRVFSTESESSDGRKIAVLDPPVRYLNIEYWLQGGKNSHGAR